MARIGFAMGIGLAAWAVLGSAFGAASRAEQAIDPGEGLVDIVAWPGYIERGESDPKYDWVTGFEKATGCQVRVKVAGTSDEMVALMNEGGFDLATVSGDASLRLIAGKRVKPIDVERWYSSRAFCPTGSPTRDASRPSTARSTSQTPLST
jgi:putative spermidine/putrescine transport system substrate-binding protein